MNDSDSPGCIARVLGLITPLACIGFFLVQVVGIGIEKPPFRPRLYYQPVENIVVSDVQHNIVKVGSGAVIAPGASVAVFNFQSPGETQGGVLISDMFATLLKDNGFAVVERDQIEQLLDEQNLLQDGLVTVSDLDIANRLGQLQTADYMVFGSVTLYESQSQEVYRPLRVLEEDRTEYAENYAAYREWYLNHIFPFSLNYFQSEDTKIKMLRVDEGVLSLDELEDALAENPLQEWRVIATLGISAKIVDVNSGQIVWMGQAETTDFTLVDAARRALDTFYQSIEA